MITIVGASASGLFTAYLLAKAGLKVQVLEKNKQVGPPQRTLIVTNKFLDVLPFDTSKVIINKINRVEFFSPNQKNSLEFKKPDLIIERQKLLKLLADNARAAGAQIHTTTEIKNFSSAVQTAEPLIDASGVKKSASAVGLIQAEVEIPEKIDPHTIQVFFDTAKTKYFFWLIPQSESGAAVGLISDDMTQARNALDEFLARKNFKVQTYQHGRVPLFTPLPCTLRGAGFAVGDAAGQVKVDTVGGVVAGLRGAQALANSIIKGTTYRREARGLNWGLTLHWLARRVLNNLTNDDYDRLLALLTPEVKKVLATYTRDEAARGALKLFLTQPRFLTFLTRIF